jgi:exodeoxyribonuclease VII small subunit
MMAKSSKSGKGSKATKDSAAKELSFEKELLKLEEIVEKLEGEMPAIDQAIKLYEQGARSLSACQKKLNQAEGRIKMLIEGGSGLELADFDEEAASDNSETASPAAGNPEESSDAEASEDAGSAKKRVRKPRAPKGRGLF